ncbi:DeoR/GlpR family DNA-binding transcription regulator [Roseibium sediminicola]|uniref:DeoR/GlpR family DNA-binding transcription regulator n=1 Tax=Roseibium sediminicola TaxID=2933272 RepID=A0ABT0GZX4_9HYPH|nr:DeoR/GlpR family DNA-binding transcription regulator [Roseibium sp. CAU 1639]MCK7614991.1 DeoR/GlpR family DNA-binding transcription regulator [Roseibium sp. CAU 1639]
MQIEHPRGRALSRKEARLQQLRDAVAKHKCLHVRDAAELLDVSEMTIRRDVYENAEILQFLGGHIVFADAGLHRPPYDLAHAAELNEPAKRAACAACVPHLKSEETLFVDCGTTLPHLINLIPNDMELTIICYALNIADMVVRKPKIKLVMLGGVYHAPTASFYPAEEDHLLGSFAINRAYISAAGVDRQLGVTCTTFREAALKRAAMARSQEKVLVVDKSKFGQVKAAAFAHLTDFDMLVTEEGCSFQP